MIVVFVCRKVAIVQILAITMLLMHKVVAQAQLMVLMVLQMVLIVTFSVLIHILPTGQLPV